MVDPGEFVTKTLVREFCEEALSLELTFSKDSHEMETKNKREVEIKKFFENGIIVIIKL